MNLRGVAGSARRVAGCVAVVAVMWGGLTAATPVSATTGVVARLGDLTVAASPLRPAADGTLTATLHVSTQASASNHLDAATAADGATVTIRHQQVSVGELPDLAGCGGDPPPPAAVDRWLHEGPLLVPGQASGHARPAEATLTVSPDAVSPAAARKVAVTLYFADGGALVVALPVLAR